MPVIGQHAVRHQPHGMAPEPFFQNADEDPIITRALQQMQPLCAAIDDMKELRHDLRAMSWVHCGPPLLARRMPGAGR